MGIFYATPELNRSPQAAERQFHILRATSSSEIKVTFYGAHGSKTLSEKSAGSYVNK